jgi:TRAP-type C4-dicarboxylate transport system substrate-binding protein
MFNSFGVEVVQMEYKDVNTGLRNGTIHGVESALDLLFSTHVEREQKYLSLCYHLYTPAFLVAGSAKCGSLPAETARAVAGIAHEMEDWTLAKGAELDSEIVRRIEAEGLAVNECDRLAFTMQSLPIYRDYAASNPQARALIKLLFAADDLGLSRVQHVDSLVGPAAH